jgi:hypothetical protein
MPVSQLSHVCGDFTRLDGRGVTSPEQVAFLGIRDIAEDTAETGTFVEAVDHLSFGRNVVRILADRNLSARGWWCSDGGSFAPLFRPRNSRHGQR